MRAKPPGVAVTFSHLRLLVRSPHLRHVSHDHTLIDNIFGTPKSLFKIGHFSKSTLIGSKKNTKIFLSYYNSYHITVYSNTSAVALVLPAARVPLPALLAYYYYYHSPFPHHPQLLKISVDVMQVADLDERRLDKRQAKCTGHDHFVRRRRNHLEAIGSVVDRLD